ncbi:MAG: HAD-IA family hydrolase [Roseibacillus sp.]
MPLFLDAAGTLIHPSKPVGQVYAHHLESATGIRIDADEMQAAFLEAFSATPPPDYSLHPFGHAAEHSWWRELVAAVLTHLGGQAAQFTSPPRPPAFDSLFDSLYSHFSSSTSWSLYPDTVEFLESASQLGPLAVVSNFDDRLAPILDGLGIGPFFEHIFTSADARSRKPDRALFDLALGRMNCAPAETAHCGDSLEADFHGATAAGLRAFHLVRPGHTLFDFLDFCTA